MEIYLASKSPRRKELLERMGLEFTVRAVNTNETMDPFRHPVSYTHLTLPTTTWV